MTSRCLVLAVCGSLQRRSANRTLLETARSVAPPDVDVALFEGLRDLPPFDPDVTDDAAPAPVLAWRKALVESDAILLASPEYGFSLPGALKNAIDWVIGSGELEGKVVGLTAAVKLAGRGQRGLEALAEPLRAVSARLVGGAPILLGPSFEADVAKLLGDVVREAREPVPPPEHGLGRPRPSALVRAWLDRANRGDAEALALLYARDAVLEPEVGPPVRGREAIRAHLAERLRRSALPVTAERLMDDGAAALLEERDAGGRRGCAVFVVRRWEIAVHRAYPARAS